MFLFSKDYLIIAFVDLYYPFWKFSFDKKYIDLLSIICIDRKIDTCQFWLIENDFLNCIHDGIYGKKIVISVSSESQTWQMVDRQF